MTSDDELLVAVEKLAVVHDRDDSQHSDGAAGDTGDNKDGLNHPEP